MLIMYGGRYKSWRSSSRDFLQLHITSSLISTNMSLKIFSLCSPLKLRAGLCVHEVNLSVCQSVSLARKNAALWAPVHVLQVCVLTDDSTTTTVNILWKWASGAESRLVPCPLTQWKDGHPRVCLAVHLQNRVLCTLAAWNCYCSFYFNPKSPQVVTMETGFKKKHTPLFARISALRLGHLNQFPRQMTAGAWIKVSV